MVRQSMAVGSEEGVQRIVEGWKALHGFGERYGRQQLVDPRCIRVDGGRLMQLIAWPSCVPAVPIGCRLPRDE